MTTIDVTLTWKLPQRLKVSREAREIEQRDIAKRLGVSRQTVSNWERGVSEPNASQFVRWAAITDYPLEWLAEGVDMNPSTKLSAKITVR